MHSPWTSLPEHHRILLLTDGFSSPFYGKTAMSLMRYRRTDTVAVIDREHAGRDAFDLFQVGKGIPVVGDLRQVPDADAVYLGIATPGGKIPDSWRATICEAIRLGMDVVSGLHVFLIEDPEYQELSGVSGSRLVDVRRNSYKTTAKGREFREGCLRIHTVGHDCSVGKMVAAVEIERELIARGLNAKFAATGQTGIMISGRGYPIDCVVSDFVNGAVEQLVTDNEQHDYVLIEGQGSISHPAFSAVTAGLLHGCAPQGLIFCYEAGRTHVKGLNTIPIVPLEKQIAAIETMANLRHPCRVIGICINTRTMNDEEAAEEVARAEERFQLPACDVYRHGAGKLADACERLRAELMLANPTTHTQAVE